MQECCFKCLAILPDRDGYENSIGETLCTDCFSAMFADRASSSVPAFAQPVLEALTDSRRSLA